jgi:hypothetical protein
VQGAATLLQYPKAGMGFGTDQRATDPLQGLKYRFIESDPAGGLRALDPVTHFGVRLDHAGGKGTGLEEERGGEGRRGWAMGATAAYRAAAEQGVEASKSMT